MATELQGMKQRPVLSAEVLSLLERAFLQATPSSAGVPVSAQAYMPFYGYESDGDYRRRSRKYTDHIPVTGLSSWGWLDQLTVYLPEAPPGVEIAASNMFYEPGIKAPVAYMRALDMAVDSRSLLFACRNDEKIRNFITDGGYRCFDTGNACHLYGGLEVTNPDSWPAYLGEAMQVFEGLLDTHWVAWSLRRGYPALRVSHLTGSKRGLPKEVTDFQSFVRKPPTSPPPTTEICF